MHNFAIFYDKVGFNNKVLSILSVYQNPTFRKKRSIIFLTFLMIVVWSAPANGGLFFKTKPPLDCRIDVSRKGIVVNKEVKLKHLPYDFRIVFMHKNRRFNDLESILGKGTLEKGVSLPVMLQVEQVKPDGQSTVLFNERIDTSGTTARAMEFSERQIWGACLKKGTYRITLHILQDVAQFQNIETYFRVYQTPNATCSD